LDALRTLPDIRIIFGHYLQNTQTCRKCGSIWLVPDEKMTDVNMATELMVDAFQNAFHTILLISADSDLSAPIEAVQRLFPGKRVVAVFPPGRSSKRLQQVATAYYRIGRNTLARSQFPDRVFTKAGAVLERPQRWR